MALFLFFVGKEKSLSIFFWEYRNRKITDDNWGGKDDERTCMCVVGKGERVKTLIIEDYVISERSLHFTNTLAM